MHCSPRFSRSSLATCMVALLTIACSKGDSGASSTDTAAATAGDASASSETGASTGSVHLEVGSGPHAGTYDAPMTSGGCSYGLAGEKSWGNQYSIDSKDPKQFSSLQLIVPDTKAAAGGTSTFELIAAFGPLFGDGATRYDVNTTNGSKKGSGKVTVEDRGTSGKVTFDVKTADGVPLKGTIDCTTVMRTG
ncbi:MAG TPA: hypothetical protein VHM30_02850 [Gemmatimonadaceae bacterium]|nr:hypothetical protein [Gemmatimonadaceae bacterium]